MRFFNTEGPIYSDKHYFIPPLERLDTELVFDLINKMKYFVLHAPRQTGKTTSLFALRDELNRSGRYRCVYVNFEVGQAAREDVQTAMESVLDELADEAKTTLDDLFVQNNYRMYLKNHGSLSALGRILSAWAARSDKPLVVLIDEIDTLVGDTLISVLRQLRTGYAKRPRRFPQSVVLCGVGDVRGYCSQSYSESEIITGGSFFNVKAKSIRLGDFSVEEAKTLLEQHTQETGQRWADGTIEEVWRLSQGQPWLVNALANRACQAVSDLGQPIELIDIEDARKRLILDRDTHFVQLAARLKEERVRSVVEWLFSDDRHSLHFSGDSLEYALELGLVNIDRRKGINIANPIYQEVIPRYLT